MLRTSEQRKRISEGHKGQIPWNKGLTRENDLRIASYSRKLLGRKKSEEHKLHMSLSRRGIKNPKLSESLNKKDIWHPNEESIGFRQRLKNLTEIEKGYIAGMIDGEGTIAIHLNKSTRDGKFYTWLTPHVSVTNTNLEIINYLTNILGKDRARISIYKRKNPAHKIAYKWLTTSPLFIGDLLSLIEPYLYGKKQNAKLMLDFLEKRTNRHKLLVISTKVVNGRNQIIDCQSSPIPESDMDFYKRSRELNRKGVYVER